MTARVRVLYVSGMGRSGSTVLGNLLGAADGFVHVGEVASLFHELRRDAADCGCGAALGQCSFWRSVLAEANVSEEMPGADAMVASRDRGVGMRYLPLYLSRAGRRLMLARMGPYAGALGRLYEAIRRVAGGAVIVDSSKEATYGAILRSIPRLEVQVVHLVRDPRAVAFSWANPKMHRDGTPIRRYSAVESSLRWSLASFGTERLLAPPPSRYRSIRYEDLCAAPSETVARVLRSIDPVLEPPVFDGPRVQVDASHVILGNPDRRFDRGAIAIRPDGRWRRGMGKRDSLVVGALTYPFLVHHGYRATTPDGEGAEAS